jgi:hypothetical protein
MVPYWFNTRKGGGKLNMFHVFLTPDMVEDYYDQLKEAGYTYIHHVPFPFTN